MHQIKWSTMYIHDIMYIHCILHTGVGLAGSLVHIIIQRHLRVVPVAPVLLRGPLRGWVAHEGPLRSA